MSKEGPLSINTFFMSFCINFYSKMKANSQYHAKAADNFIPINASEISPDYEYTLWQSPQIERFNFPESR
jgi:hypothetical protein